MAIYNAIILANITTIAPSLIFFCSSYKGKTIILQQLKSMITND